MSSIKEYSFSRIRSFGNDQLLSNLENLIRQIISLEQVEERVSKITESSDYIPGQFVSDISFFKSGLKDAKTKLIAVDSLALTDVNNLQAVTDAINKSQAELNNIISGNKRGIEACNYILTFFSTTYSTELDAITLLKSKSEEGLKKVEEIVSKSEVVAGKLVLQEYSKAFEKDEERFKIAANTWLVAGIVYCTVFIIIIICSFTFNWFNVVTQEPLLFQGQPIYIEKALQYKTVVNYPNLVSKFILLSIGLYFVNFIFKQFAINKNLQTQNSHRKNALNSYELFTKSIGDGDPASRNALMLQVAKAIYEISPSGYISEKQADSGGSIIEVTKFLTPDK